MRRHKDRSTSSASDRNQHHKGPQQILFRVLVLDKPHLLEAVDLEAPVLGATGPGFRSIQPPPRAPVPRLARANPRLTSASLATKATDMRYRCCLPLPTGVIVETGVKCGSGASPIAVPYSPRARNARFNCVAFLDWKSWATCICLWPSGPLARNARRVSTRACASLNRIHQCLIASKRPSNESADWPPTLRGLGQSL